MLGPEGEIVAALLAVCFFTMACLSSLLGDSARRFDSDRLPTQGDLRGVEGGYLLHLKWSKTRQELGGGGGVKVGKSVANLKISDQVI